MICMYVPIYTSMYVCMYVQICMCVCTYPFFLLHYYPSFIPSILSISLPPRLDRRLTILASRPAPDSPDMSPKCGRHARVTAAPSTAVTQRLARPDTSRLYLRLPPLSTQVPGILRRRTSTMQYFEISFLYESVRECSMA